ncbi:MAG: Smr/MutS family protein, partial [Minicystis sp.]
KTSIGGELEPRAVNDSIERGPVDASDLRAGMRVYVPRLRAEAEIVEVLGGGQLRVAAGSLKLSTTVSEVRAVQAAPTRSAQGNKGKASGEPSAKRDYDPRGKPAPVFDFDAAADTDMPMQTSDNAVDLRGLRAHEAVSMAEQFLDRTLGAGRKVAFLIHGHGTGALRDAIREMLRSSSHVAKSRAGGPSEGGDGVTVVWLRW